MAPRGRKITTRVARSLTAAAQSLRGPTADDGTNGKATATKRTPQAWKADARAYRRAVPEVMFATNFVANSMRRLRFFPALQITDDDPPVPVTEAWKPRTATDTDDGQPYITEAAASEIMRQWKRLAKAMPDVQTDWGNDGTLIGEIEVVGRNLDTPDEEWFTLPEHLVTKGDTTGVYKAKDPDTGADITLDTREDGKDYLIRVWRRDPDEPWLSTANIRACLDVAEELVIIDRSCRSVSKSRNNAGLLYLPNELDLQPVGGVEEIDPGDDEDDTSDDTVTNPSEGDDAMTPFERNIVLSFITPTHDDESAAAAAPHMLRGPGDQEKNVTWKEVGRKLDPATAAREEALIVRLAHGMDLPPEVLTGMFDASHWSVWAIDDKTYSAHIEPPASILASGLCEAFLVPMCDASGVDVGILDRLVVGIDPAALVVRPNRSQDAKDAHDRLVISDAALRNALNFADTDAPDDEEVARREASGQGAPVDPSLHPEDGGSPVPATEQGQASALTAASAGASDLGARLAGIDARLRDRLQIAASAALTAALTTAGSRLRARVQGDPDLAKAVKGVASTEVGAIVGQGHANTGDLLTAGDFDHLHEQWNAWVAQARSQATAAVRAEGERRGIDSDVIESAVAEMDAAQAQDSDAGWQALISDLLDTGRRRIYSPDATPDVGEFDPHLSVAPVTIRRALAVMGDGTSDDPDAIPGGGPATGATMMRLGVGFALGAATVAYVWTSGTSDRPFEPHEALDGALLSGPDDPQLQFDGWPADENGGFLQVGDHPGCQCSMDAVIAFGFTEGQDAEG